MKHPTRTRVLLNCTGKHRIYLDKLCVFPSTRCDKVTQRVVSVAIAVTRHDVTNRVPTIFVSTEIVFKSRLRNDCVWIRFCVWIRIAFESELCLNQDSVWTPGLNTCLNTWIEHLDDRILINRFCFNYLWLNPKSPVYKHGFSHFKFIRSCRLLTHTTFDILYNKPILL